MTNCTEPKLTPSIANSPTTGSLASLLLTEAQVADRLAISPRTLQMWRYKGGGPRFAKVGTAVRYRPADVDAWLEEQTRSSTSDPGPDAA